MKCRGSVPNFDVPVFPDFPPPYKGREIREEASVKKVVEGC